MSTPSNYTDGYLPWNISFLRRDKTADFSFRFRIFEHAIKWINATTVFDVKLGDDGNIVYFCWKQSPEEIECAKDKENAVLFSSAVHVARTESMWSNLPLTALEIVIEFVIGNKKPYYVVSNASVKAANGEYVFYKVVESTADNYRNVMYVKHPAPGHSGEALYLLRAPLFDEGLVWGITSLNNAADFKSFQQALYWSSDETTTEEWRHGATKARDYHISVTTPSRENVFKNLFPSYDEY